MTPLQETALRNGNLHTHLKILFIRRKLFHILGGSARERTESRTRAKISNYCRALGIWAALPVRNEREWLSWSSTPAPAALHTRPYVSREHARREIELLLQFKNQPPDLRLRLDLVCRCPRFLITDLIESILSIWIVPISVEGNPLE